MALPATDALGAPEPVGAATDRSADVILIGAGLAGLSAARDLRAQGASVIVLEARGRAGGRVHSQRLEGGQMIDLGAQFMGDAHAYVAALADEAGLRRISVAVPGDLLHLSSEDAAPQRGSPDSLPLSMIDRLDALQGCAARAWMCLVSDPSTWTKDSDWDEGALAFLAIRDWPDPGFLQPIRSSLYESTRCRTSWGIGSHRGARQHKRTRPMKPLFAACASLAVIAAQTAPLTAGPADRAALQALNGTFQSPAVEEWYGGYGTREFVFANGYWSLTFVHALDPAMTQRTFQYRTGGGYTVGQASEAVPGAYRTVFDEDWKRLTLLTPVPEIAVAMGMAECGLTVNLEADISDRGCAAWRPVTVCGEDHDLLALSDDGLHFGIRPADNDMCTADKTPTALLSAVVAR